MVNDGTGISTQADLTSAPLIFPPREIREGETLILSQNFQGIYILWNASTVSGLQRHLQNERLSNMTFKSFSTSKVIIYFGSFSINRHWRGNYGQVSENVSTEPLPCVACVCACAGPCAYTCLRVSVALKRMIDCLWKEKGRS